MCMTPVIPPAKWQQKIISWYDKFGRKTLPWQQQITPYRVWLSEIMLQQTQVATVIPYFHRFIERFPTVQALAGASEDDVLVLWAGLGYYARARNLHRAAQMVVAEFGGEFPSEQTELERLPGVGRSTAAAIRALAFKQPATILDGNVKRLLARTHAIDAPVKQAKVIQDLWILASDVTPRRDIHKYTQAVMDLGALICTRTKPQCEVCPLQADCLAHRRGEQALYPVSEKRQKTKPQQATNMLILQDAAGRVLLQKRPRQGIWGGLWSLPAWQEALTAHEFCEAHLAVEGDAMMRLPTFKHSFTHYDLWITPWQATLATGTPRLSNSDWYPATDKAFALAAPVSKLLKSFFKEAVI
jgi:A/G-specific adenine glycosylase